MIAISIIMFGVWASSVNMIKYVKGNYDIKTSVRDMQDDITQISDNGIMLESDEDNVNLGKNINSLEQKKKLEKVLYSEQPKLGDEIGELYIPKLKATLPIYQGTSEDELVKGVGHFVQSVLPGEKDNSVLSGHRDTVFRKLGEVGIGDLLVVKTSAGKFEYKVEKVRIVDKDDRTVIVPRPKATLTVSTCYPFSYIGAAPKRYVLVAYLASETLY